MKIKNRWSVTPPNPFPYFPTHGRAMIGPNAIATTATSVKALNSFAFIMCHLLKIGVIYLTLPIQNNFLYSEYRNVKSNKI
jgi:hypothetical protein